MAALTVAARDTAADPLVQLIGQQGQRQARLRPVRQRRAHDVVQVSAAVDRQADLAGHGVPHRVGDSLDWCAAAVAGDQPAAGSQSELR